MIVDCILQSCDHSTDQQCCDVVDCLCRPADSAICAGNVIEEQCGEEIANEIRTLGREVFSDLGCPPIHKRTLRPYFTLESIF